MSITVQGYSGCGIIVRPRDAQDPAEAGCHNVVEKSSPEPSYDVRLVKQIDKQENHAAALAAAGVSPQGDDNKKRTPQIVIPRVLFRRERPNHAGQPSLVVGMTFEHHVDCVGFLSSASPDKVHVFVDALMQLLQRHVAASPVGVVPTAVISNKMADILRVCKNNSKLGPIVEELVPMIEQLKGWIDASPEGHAMPLGVCHGDLTLSNVLIQHGPSAAGSKSGGPCDAEDMKIVLIDFLDSFVETPVADLVKLCKDLVYGWTIRSMVAHQALRVDLTRIYMAYGVAYDALLKLFSGHDWFKRYFRFFFVVNQLRVLQYCKSDDDRAYLFDSVKEQYALWQAETADA